MPDSVGLELIAQTVRERLGDEAVVGTHYAHEQATLEVAPGAVADVLQLLRDDEEEAWPHLMSVHGCDYLPDEPRLAVHYQLLSRERIDRLGVKTRLGVDDPVVPSVIDLYPTADYQEREVFDMFGIRFDGHPDLRRILMPEDYEGYPQRRDFPMGGEPVLYTFNEGKYPRWYD